MEWRGKTVNMSSEPKRTSYWSFSQGEVTIDDLRQRLGNAPVVTLNLYSAEVAGASELMDSLGYVFCGLGASRACAPNNSPSFEHSVFFKRREIA